MIKELLDHGFSLFPIELGEEKDKGPKKIGNGRFQWKKCREQQLDLKELEKECAFGIVCGYDGLEVIDIDAHKWSPTEILEEVYNSCSEILNKLPIVKTINGGYHIYFKCDYNEGNKKLAMRNTDEGKPEVLIETRGDGGYVAGPPTEGYVIQSGSFTNDIRITPKEREILISNCKGLNEVVKKEQQHQEAVSKGNDRRAGDMYLSDLSTPDETIQLLKDNGWKYDGKGMFTRPGKKEGVSATFGKVGANKFYCFSSNAYPFESDTSYSMLAVRALLLHRGDYKECVKELAERYNLKPAASSTKKKEEKRIYTAEEQDEISKFFRIGDQYFKKIKIYDSAGNASFKLDKRNRLSIIDDFGKEAVKDGLIPKYDAFCNVPDHLNYKSIVGNNYNMYYEIPNKPKKGKFPCSHDFMLHVFGRGEIEYQGQVIKEVDLGYDYLTLLFREPLQILPVLCLVSKENSTGKTTFSEWLMMLFGSNATIIGSSELTSDFNASYATKLIASVDESYIEYKKMDKIKSMTTGGSINLRMMHKDHQKIPFFCKFVFNSNREDNFISINDDDIRYWVRKLNTYERFDPNFKANLKKECAAFCHHLSEREMVTKNEGRAYFDHELLFTKYLEKVKINSRPDLCNDMLDNLLSFMEEQGHSEIKFTIQDLKERFYSHNHSASVNKLRSFFKNDLRIEHSGNPSTYKPFGDAGHHGKKGRYYKLEINQIRRMLDLEEVVDTNYSYQEDNGEKLPF